MNVHYCVLFSSRLRVRIRVGIRFSVWLVSCYAHVLLLLSIAIVIVTLPVVRTAVQMFVRRVFLMQCHCLCRCCAGVAVWCDSVYSVGALPHHRQSVSWPGVSSRHVISSRQRPSPRRRPRRLPTAGCPIWGQWASQLDYASPDTVSRSFQILMRSWQPISRRILTEQRGKIHNSINLNG